MANPYKMSLKALNAWQKRGFDLSAEEYLESDNKLKSKGVECWTNYWKIRDLKHLQYLGWECLLKNHFNISACKQMKNVEQLSITYKDCGCCIDSGGEIIITLDDNTVLEFNNWKNLIKHDITASTLDLVRRKRP